MFRSLNIRHVYRPPMPSGAGRVISWVVAFNCRLPTAPCRVKVRVDGQLSAHYCNRHYDEAGAPRGPRKGTT